MNIRPNLKLDIQKNRVENMQTGTSHSLEPRLIQILDLLLEANGQVVSRNKIIQTIWGNYNSGDQLLTHSISLLRKTLGPDIIVTVPKSGYYIHKGTTFQKVQLINRFVNQKTVGISLLLGYMIKLIFFGHH